MAEEGKVDKDVIASLLGVDTSEEAASEAWEVKAANVKQEKIDDIRITLEAIGLNDVDVNAFMSEDVPEQWEVKIEKEKQQVKSEIVNIRSSLGIAADDPLLDEIREAWEVKVDKEQDEERAVNVENPVQGKRAGSISIENPVRLSLKPGGNADGDAAAAAAAAAAASASTMDGDQEGNISTIAVP